MRGYLKRRRQKRVIAEHVKRFGGFQFQGQPIRVPDELDLGIRALIADGTYEASECALIERFLEPDVPVIELGGCLGLVSNYVANRLAETTQFIVVEANPKLLDACRDNATCGGQRGRTELVHKAVAYNAETVSFDVSDNVHVSRLSDEGSESGVLIETTTLHALVERLGQPPTYTLICDIEGAETELLTHDLDALSRCGCLIIELHPHAYEGSVHSTESLIEQIQSTGLEQVAQDENVFAFRRPASQ